MRTWGANNRCEGSGGRKKLWLGVGGREKERVCGRFRVIFGFGNKNLTGVGKFRTGKVKKMLQCNKKRT